MAGFCMELQQQMWFITPRGEARAIMMFDYGQEDDLYWLCINQDAPHTGTLSMYHNSQVRVMANETMLRGKPDTVPEPIPVRSSFKDALGTIMRKSNESPQPAGEATTS